VSHEGIEACLRELAAVVEEKRVAAGNPVVERGGF
jgi:hypothetical protein